jgi:hypothetical protein
MAGMDGPATYKANGCFFGLATLAALSLSILSFIRGEIGLGIVRAVAAIVTLALTGWCIYVVVSESDPPQPASGPPKDVPES